MAKELHIHFLCPFCGAIHYLKRELTGRKNRRTWHFDLLARCVTKAGRLIGGYNKSPISIDIVEW